MSRFATNEPYFGRQASGRFDDPREPARFGVCYLGQTLTVALAETVLRDQLPRADGYHYVARSEISGRFHFEVHSPATVRLADLRGAALRRVGLTADFIACRNYWLTQPWGVAIHDHPQAVDGIVYVSRQVPSLQAVALCSSGLQERSHCLHQASLASTAGLPPQQAR